MKRILIISRDPALSFRQMKDGNGISHDAQFQFFINDFDCQPDFVVVNGKGLRVEREFQVPRKRTILLTGEPYGVLHYPRKYYSQFGAVCSCQEGITDYPGGKVYYTQAAIPWYVGVVFNPDNTCRFTMNFDDVANAAPKKEKLISIISSTKSFSRGHVDRLRFVKALKERYGDQVDIFGHGFNNFDDKWDVLAPYKYHIVIENSRSDYYWTEKIADCFLAGTYPLYYGSRTIGRSFPENSYTPIDIRKPKEAFRAIDRAVEMHCYEHSIEVLRECKEMILGKYNFFSLIEQVCREIPVDGEQGTTLLYPMRHFFSFHNMYLYTIGRNMYKLMGRKYKQ